MTDELKEALEENMKKILVELNVTKWLRDGDHPKVQKLSISMIGDGIGNDTHCSDCGKDINDHGYIDYRMDRIVCPGNFIAEIENQYIILKK